MKQKIYQIDAFTTTLYGGNPAAVCILEKWLANDTMQKIAAENNLAETAFAVTKRAIRAPNIAPSGISKYENKSEPTKAMNEARYMFWFPSCSA